MPTSIAAQNTTTPTLATDTTLVTQPGPAGGGCFLLRVDAANLANGETLTLTIQTRARPAGVTRTLYHVSVAHVQADPIKDSPVVPVPASSELVVVLRQDGGTARAYDWALYRLDA